MFKQFFKVYFHSDIILNSASVTTTGTADTLDYIPGSNFLGMLAGNNGYESFKEKVFDVFHSGKVRFGDGHIYKSSQSLKLPFSYFINKGEKLNENSIMYYHHILTTQKREELRNKGIQLKQVRSGYFNQDGEILNLEYSYTQKSAYDVESRRSKEKAMFGYKAIKRGSEFIFEVSFENENLKEEVSQKLIGFKKLGKAKNSQYGKIEISKIDYENNFKQKDIENNFILLYAKSNLALIDKTGNSLLTPTLESLKLPINCDIDFEKSQIRTRSYSSYNFVRATRDYERIIIEKGSVIAVTLSNDFDLNQYRTLISKGVGNYLSEGFGEILINPEFLYDMKFSAVNKNKDLIGIDIEDNFNNTLTSFLENKFSQKETDKTMIKKAFENRDKFEKTTTSQWGQIRRLASQFNDEQIIEELDKYLNKGIAKDKWKDNYKLLVTLINSQTQKARFTKLLAIEVSKYLKQKVGDN